MISGLGNDIIEISRIAASIARHGSRFLDRVFTPAEQQYCLSHRYSERNFAGRFAAKEALVKAFGTGLREGISWLDMEITNDDYGKPLVSLSPALSARLGGDPQILLSISHSHEYAIATVIWVS